MVGKEEFDRLSGQLKRISTYLDALESRLLVSDEQSIRALTMEQVREDYSTFQKMQLDILEFYRKWRVQSKSEQELEVDSNILALASELSKLEPDVLCRLQQSMLRLVKGGPEEIEKVSKVKGG